MNDFATTQLADLHRLIGELESQADFLDELARWTANLIVHGSRVLVCGNGGSAAEAQHFATELIGRYLAERRPLPAIALSADGSLLTCIGNDYVFADIFTRQVQAHGQRGDLLVALSTSGKSRNVLHAVRSARAKGMYTLALLGKDGGDLAECADREWIVPSERTARIQEAHLFFIHVVCDYVDAALANQKEGQPAAPGLVA